MNKQKTLYEIELEKEIKQLKRYKILFDKAKECKDKTDKWAQKCLKENEELKDMLKRTVCQSECYKHKEAEKYKKVLQEIKDFIAKDEIYRGLKFGYLNITSDILSKIAEVL